MQTKTRFRPEPVYSNTFRVHKQKMFQVLWFFMDKNKCYLMHIKPLALYIKLQFSEQMPIWVIKWIMYKYEATHIFTE